MSHLPKVVGTCFPVYGSDIGAERWPVDVTPRDDAAAQM
jgi:hypothetical protein